MDKDWNSTTLEVHGERHGGSAKDVVWNQFWWRQSSNPSWSEMAGEHQQHEGEHTEAGDLSIISDPCGKGEQGGAQMCQRNQQCGGVAVPSQRIHKYWPRQLVWTLLRLEPGIEEVQHQASMQLLLRAAPHKATISATLWGVLQIWPLSVAAHKWNVPTVKKVTSYLAVGAHGSRKPPE